MNEENPIVAIQASETMMPIRLGDVLKEMGLTAPMVPARELIGEEFVILRGRRFTSRFSENKHAWFIIFKYPDDDEIYSTILGGDAVVELLDAWASTNRYEPLLVYLEWVNGGRYGGYYRLR